MSSWHASYFTENPDALQRQCLQIVSTTYTHVLPLPTVNTEESALVPCLYHFLHSPYILVSLIYADFVPEIFFIYINLTFPGHHSYYHVYSNLSPHRNQKSFFDPVHPPAITDHFSALFYAIFHKLSAVSNVNPPSFLKLTLLHYRASLCSHQNHWSGLPMTQPMLIPMVMSQSSRNLTLSCFTCSSYSFQDSVSSFL